MLVRIKARRGYGDRFGNLYRCGETAEYADHLALKLIRLGIAEIVPTVQTTEAAPSRNAALRTTKPKARTNTP